MQEGGGVLPMLKEGVKIFEIMTHFYLTLSRINSLYYALLGCLDFNWISPKNSA